jgi:hypothetical protein
MTRTATDLPEVLAYIEAHPDQWLQEAQADLPATSTGPDLVLADEVLAHIEAHPERWEQGVWLWRSTDTCHASGCFAGWAAMLRGWAPVFHWHGSGDDVRGPNGGMEFVGDVAAELLRLTVSQADRLFAAANTLDDLRQVVAELHGAEWRPLSWER